MSLMNKLWYSNSILSKIVSILLYPLSLIWLLIDKLKSILIIPYYPMIKTICVGNINVGGTGKTPITIYLFKILKKIGYNPIFLSSAYKSNVKYPTMVNSHSSKFGDEALILYKIGDTVVSRNRLKGVKFIENLSPKKKYDVIIMDDGLQNYSVKKHISFLTIDRNMMFGNGLCVPSGPLRQSYNTCSKNINAIIFTGDNNKVDKFNNFNKRKFNSYTKLNLKGFSIINKKYLAFSGLANNLKFFNSLIRENFNLHHTKEFSDHHVYKDKDIIKLIEFAKKYDLNLITTEKDFVKVPKKFHSKIKYVPIDIEFNKNDLNDLELFLINSLND